MPQTLADHSVGLGRWTRNRTPFHNVDLPRNRRSICWKTIEAARAGFIGKASRRIRGVLEEIKDLSVREVERSGIARLAVPAVRDLLDRQEDKFEEAFRDIYLMVGSRFATRTAEQLRGKSTKQEDEPSGILAPNREGPFSAGQGPILSSWEQEVDRFIQNEGGDLIKNVSQTTKDEIMSAVQSGVEEGEGIDRIARRIDENVGTINRQRARMIGRTEVIRASNQATNYTANRLNITVKKEWIATMDSRVRDTHLQADGQVVPKDSSFTVGGFPAQYPADPQLPPRESIACRCTLAFRRVS